MSDVTPNDIPARVAVLEEIARQTRETMADLRTDLRQSFADLRAEIRDLRSESRSDYRWQMGLMLGGFGALLGVVAHGFHWI